MAVLAIISKGSAVGGHTADGEERHDGLLGMHDDGSLFGIETL